MRDRAPLRGGASPYLRAAAVDPIRRVGARLGVRARGIHPSSPAPLMSSTVTFEIPRDPAAPGEARRAIERLNDRIAPDVVPDVKLLVSELITNSVTYGGLGEVTLKVDTASPRRLRIEAIDQGAGFAPVARNRPAAEDGGWGLHLVRRSRTAGASTRAPRTCGSRSTARAASTDPGHRRPPRRARLA
jgi:anti-sigma regulatory factor (Ser/Thr protein kinase)